MVYCNSHFMKNCAYEPFKLTYQTIKCACFPVKTDKFRFYNFNFLCKYHVYAVSF